MKLAEHSNGARERLLIRTFRTPAAAALALGAMLAVQIPEARATSLVPLTVPITNFSNALRNAMPKENTPPAQPSTNVPAPTTPTNQFPASPVSKCDFDAALKQKLDETLKMFAGRYARGHLSYKIITSQTLPDSKQVKGCEENHYRFTGQLIFTKDGDDIKVRGSASIQTAQCPNPNAIWELYDSSVMRIYNSDLDLTVNADGKTIIRQKLLPNHDLHVSSLHSNQGSQGKQANHN